MFDEDRQVFVVAQMIPKLVRVSDLSTNTVRIQLYQRVGHPRSPAGDLVAFLTFVVE